jgi:hypothetical protein
MVDPVRTPPAPDSDENEKQYLLELLIALTRNHRYTTNDVGLAVLRVILGPRTLLGRLRWIIAALVRGL